MLGLEHAALRLSGNISSVLRICAEDGKLQLAVKSFCPFWSFWMSCLKNTSSYNRWWMTWFRRSGVQKSCWVGEVLGAAAGVMTNSVVGPSTPPHTHTRTQLPCLQTPFAQICKHHCLNAFGFSLGSSTNSSTKPHPCWPQTLKKKRTMSNFFIFCRSLWRRNTDKSKALWLIFSLSTWKTVGQN